jgi:hypothetical protein
MTSDTTKACGISESRCAEVREGCRKTIKAEMNQCLEKVMGNQEKFLEMLHAMDEKIDELMKLFDRVRELEVWRGKINGKAEEKQRLLNQRDREEQLRRVVAEISKQSGGKVKANFRTRSEDGLVLPKWALLGFIPFLIIIIILAAVAGEKVIPWLLQTPMPK